jgi:hypothetical protein
LHPENLEVFDLRNHRESFLEQLACSTGLQKLLWSNTFVNFSASLRRGSA